MERVLPRALFIRVQPKYNNRWHGEGKRQQGNRLHNDSDGQHNYGMGQQGDKRQDDGDRRHDDGHGRHNDWRHDDGKGHQGDSGTMMVTGGTTTVTGGTMTGGTTMARGRQRQQHHLHQSTNRSTIARTFTSPDNLDLFKLIYSI